MKKTFLSLALILLAASLLLPGLAFSQEEVASSLSRYKQHEASTGYYEEYEVLPQRRRPLITIPGVTRGVFPYSPTAAQVRVRTRLADSHQGIKFYKNLRCVTCHQEQARDLHTTRAKLTCRQCHGGEPIASIQHYYSPMNPIRKHAYVCAKCHQGASASFASYIIHEPETGAASTRKAFPILFYAYWLMLVLLVGTLAFFVPHSLLVGLRELFIRKKKPGSEGKDAS